ncbi:hypothetical protein [Marinobacter sp. X15-166B]|uniref:hypothetical protein n=1 Tax=Marinobacter sp. X15-166B TaxID=1897620 RepID=UPI00085BF034|nr:hypothetical protein [Marinobacter sp. X15-166B]OEY67486.1 hypothetical protein BG841_14280 [Marinobacter sp. X15-166B]
MNDRNAVLGEHYSHKVSAEFDSQTAADRAKESLERAGIPEQQIRIIKPDDPAMARKIEPESTGIARSMVKAHVKFGVVGLVAGLVIAAVLVAVGPAFARTSPVLTFIALGFFGGGIVVAVRRRSGVAPGPRSADRKNP